MTLDQIGRECGTDKSSLSHNYTPLYEQYFSKWQYEPITLLEVGIGGYEYPEQGGETQRYDPTGVYEVPTYELRAVEHRHQLKDAFKRSGLQGVSDYIESVKAKAIEAVN